MHPFCIMLASNGWQRASEKAIKNGHAEHIHNNCDCTYAVRFSKNVDVEGYDPDAMYEEYINAGDTQWERINALRRKHYAANRDKINAQKRAAYARRKVTLHTYDDPIREIIGSAEESHPEELKRILDKFKQNGVEVERRRAGSNAMAYQPNPAAGKPGRVVMEEGASISAWMHEEQHFDDDKAEGFTGFRLFTDPKKAAELEERGYDVEIEFARGLGYNDVVERLEKLKENRLKDFL